MNAVTLDQVAVSQLHDATEYLKLRDTTGRLLGYFVPVASTPTQLICGVKSPLSADERERRSKEPGRQLGEFWSAMRQKHPNGGLR